jgi:hypothetical protein
MENNNQNTSFIKTIKISLVSFFLMFVTTFYYLNYSFDNEVLVKTDAKYSLTENLEIKEKLINYVDKQQENIPTNIKKQEFMNDGNYLVLKELDKFSSKLDSKIKLESKISYYIIFIAQLFSIVGVLATFYLSLFTSRFAKVQEENKISDAMEQTLQKDIAPIFEVFAKFMSHTNYLVETSASLYNELNYNYSLMIENNKKNTYPFYCNEYEKIKEELKKEEYNKYIMEDEDFLVWKKQINYKKEENLYKRLYLVLFKKQDSSIIKYNKENKEFVNIKNNINQISFISKELVKNYNKIHNNIIFSNFLNNDYESKNSLNKEKEKCENMINELFGKKCFGGCIDKKYFLNKIEVINPFSIAYLENTFFNLSENIKKEDFLINNFLLFKRIIEEENNQEKEKNKDFFVYEFIGLLLENIVINDNKVFNFGKFILSDIKEFTPNKEEMKKNIEKLYVFNSVNDNIDDKNKVVSEDKSFFSIFKELKENIFKTKKIKQDVRIKLLEDYLNKVPYNKESYFSDFELKC